MAKTKEKTDLKKVGETILSVENNLKRKLNFKRKKDELLEKIGIIGWNKISTPVMASLFSGCAICFVAEAGTGKTYAAKQTANYLLSTTISCIDASKCDWDDLIGPYNLEEYKKGKIEYLDTPVSVSNKEFLFVDEITRADNKVQNGLLELLKDNTLNGRKTSVLYKWAAANPLSHEGTQPLSEALGDRFVFTLDIPQLLELGHDNLKLVAQQGADVDDEVIAKYADIERYREKYKNDKEGFTSYMKGVGKQYKIVKEKLDLDEYCISLAISYMASLKRTDKDKTNPYTIEPRRMNQLLSAITSTLAVELHEYYSHLESLSEDDKKEYTFTKDEMDSWLHEVIFQTVLFNVNTKLTGKTVDTQNLETAHNIALKNINSDKLQSVIYKIRQEHDESKRFFRALIHSKEEPLEIHDAFERLSSLYVNDESNGFGTEYDLNSEKLVCWNVYIPFLFILHKDSPLKPLLSDLPVEFIEKMKTLLKHCYEYELLDDENDYPVELREFFGKIVFDTLDDDKRLLDTFNKDITSLPKEQIMLREVAFRRMISEETIFGTISFFLGLEEDTTDAKQKKELMDDVAKEYEEVVVPRFRYILKQVNKEYQKLLDILKDEGKMNLLK